MQSEKVLQLPIKSLTESKLNPRRFFEPLALAELAEDIKLHGILEPLIGRQNGRGHEIVFGKRRLRAAKLAKLTTVPCIVRDLTDDEVEEMAAAENLMRVDLTPMEESAIFARKIAKTSVEEAAARYSKEPRYVAERAGLQHLIEPAAKLLDDNKIEVGHALIISRLAIPEQKHCLQWLFDRGENYAQPVEALRRYVRQTVMLDLAEAPFNIEDATLVPAAPSCLACPKRTGSNPTLFGSLAPDKAGKNLCTDRACYAGKVKAHLVQLETKLTEAGEKIARISVFEYAPDAERIKDVLYPGQFRPVTGTEHCENTRLGIVVQVGRWRSEQKIGDSIRICIDPKCAIHTEQAARRAQRTKKTFEEQAQTRKNNILEGKPLELRRRLASAIVAKVPSHPTLEIRKLIARDYFDHIYTELQKVVLPLIGIEPKKDGHIIDCVTPLTDALAGWNEQQLSEFLIACIAAHYIEPPYNAKDDTLVRLADLLKVDYHAVKAEVTAEVNQKLADIDAAVKRRKDKNVKDFKKKQKKSKTKAGK